MLPRPKLSPTLTQFSPQKEEKEERKQKKKWITPSSFKAIDSILDSRRRYPRDCCLHLFRMYILWVTKQTTFLFGSIY